VRNNIFCWPYLIDGVNFSFFEGASSPKAVVLCDLSAAASEMKGPTQPLFCSSGSGRPIYLGSKAPPAYHPLISSTATPAEVAVAAVAAIRDSSSLPI